MRESHSERSVCVASSKQQFNKMNQSVVNFKVFLNENGGQEVRRFSVEDSSVATSFLYMKERILILYPRLRQASFRITWQDSDGDNITITSDEDLITAYTEMNGNMKVLHVEVPDQKYDEPIAEVYVTAPQPTQYTCDVCDKTIQGFRYHCMQCPDYDLCAECERKSHHSHHIMMRLSPNLEVPRCMPKLMRHLAGSIRKAGIHASKEAHRASKRCARSAAHVASTAAGVAQGNASENKQGNSTTSSTEEKSECPMDMNFMDLAEVINEVLAKTVGPATTGQPSTSEAPNLMDMARTVLTNIFGEQVTTPSGNSAQQNKTGENATNAKTTEPTPEPTPMATTPVTISSGASTPNNTPVATAPMEVDKDKESVYPTIPENLKEKEKNPEPGWMFVQPQLLQQQQQQPQQVQQPQEQRPTETSAQPGLLGHLEDPKIREGFRQLLEMGFSNEAQLITLLKRFDGNVGQVIRHLLETNPN